MAGATDRGGRGEAGPRADASRALTAWSIPEIRVVKDDQGRLRIDQTDPATYGAYAARQLLATAEADPKYRDGMTKRPSTPSISLTYIDEAGELRKIGVQEISCRMDGDALVLTQFKNAEGEKVKDLPITIPGLGEPDDDVDDADRLHAIAMAELGDMPSPPTELEPEYEAPGRRRLESGGSHPGRFGNMTRWRLRLRQRARPRPHRPPSRRRAAQQSCRLSRRRRLRPPDHRPVRRCGLDDGEAASLRTLIEAKAGQTRWASAILMQAAERHPSDRRLQNEHLANLLKVSVDLSRAESRTPLGVALRGVLEEVHAYKASVLDRDPLKAQKLALQPFARTVLEATPVDDGPVKVVSGTAQRTPAQVLAKLEDPKLARATRVKFLLEIVPELIETWRPDKESGRSEAANENSPAIVRRMFTVANEQRQQRKYIDDGSAFKKATERYAGLASKLPKDSPTKES